MDSPTLARVERARIRLEAQALNNNENHSLERRILDPKVSHNHIHTKQTITLYRERSKTWQQLNEILEKNQTKSKIIETKST